MKGQCRIARELLKRAYSEGVAGGTGQHLRVVDALSNDDLNEIQRSGRLSAETAITMPAAEHIVHETVALLRRCLRGPSDQLLEQHGIRITRVDEGMSVAEYEEFGHGDE